MNSILRKLLKKKTFRNETLKEYEALLKENGGYLFKFLKYIYSDSNVLRRMLFWEDDMTAFTFIWSWFLVL